MKRTTVIATKASPYGARVKVGDRREVSAPVGRVLVALRLARYPNASDTPGEKPKIRKSTYQRRDMVATKPDQDA